MLNEEEIIEAEGISKKKEVVKKLLDFYNLSQSNPIERLRNEMKEMSTVIAEDFKIIRTEGEIISDEEGRKGESNLKVIGSNKNDKLFERIMIIFDKSDKIYNAISAGEKGDAKEKGAKTNDKHEGKVTL